AFFVFLGAAAACSDPDSEKTGTADPRLLALPDALVVADAIADDGGAAPDADEAGASGACPPGQWRVRDHPVGFPRPLCRLPCQTLLPPYHHCGTQTGDVCALGSDGWLGTCGGSSSSSSGGGSSSSSSSGSSGSSGGLDAGGGGSDGGGIADATIDDATID